MFFIPNSLLLAIFTSTANVIQAQEQSSAYRTVTVQPVEPNGLQNSNSSLESTVPLECGLGCFIPYGTYYNCFIGSSIPGDTTPINQTLCDSTVCQQGLYDELLACLNCVIANGDERPFGYSENTSMTAAPTGSRLQSQNGLVNLTVANAVLQNVTQKCASLSTTLTGESTITASPTTTGPYLTSWTSGQDVTITQWTGLTGYTSGLDSFTQTRVTTLYSNVAAATGAASASATSGMSTAIGSTTGSMGAASASPTSAATRSLVRSILGILLGALLGGVAVHL